MLSPTPHAHMRRDIFPHFQRIPALRKPNLSPLHSRTPPPQLSLHSKLKSLSTRRPVLIRPGTIRSSDEMTTVIESGGRLVIPKRHYERAIAIYEGSQTLIQDLDASEREGTQRILTGRFSPSPRRQLRIRTRVYSPANATEPKSPIEARFSILQMALSRPFPRTISPTLGKPSLA